MRKFVYSFSSSLYYFVNNWLSIFIFILVSNFFFSLPLIVSSQTYGGCSYSGPFPSPSLVFTLTLNEPPSQLPPLFSYLLIAALDGDLRNSSLPLTGDVTADLQCGLITNDSSGRLSLIPIYVLGSAINDVGVSSLDILLQLQVDISSGTFATNSQFNVALIQNYQTAQQCDDGVTVLPLSGQCPSSSSSSSSNWTSGPILDLIMGLLSFLFVVIGIVIYHCIDRRQKRKQEEYG